MSEYKLEVEHLKNEIKRLKSDKDFVWTLWKRLQLSTPDVADAMSLVAQREKNKNEDSIAELVEAIKARDDRIEELRISLLSKEKENETLKKSKAELAFRSSQLENQCSDLTEKASKLDRLLSKQDERNQREVITSYEQERKELLNTVSKLQSQITGLRDEKNHLKLDNVDLQEKIKNLEYLKDSASRLRLQIDDADAHMVTQEETIRLLRDQLEQNIQFDNNCLTEDGYSSDRTEEYQSKKRRNTCVTESDSVVDDEQRPVTPIEDLNYKVDRLAMHMNHLQQCVTDRHSRHIQPSSRSRSTPPKRNLRSDNQREENNRKIIFLKQKLSKTECMLEEEKKNSVSATEFLKKANTRVQSLQLTIKQLRKQVEDNKCGESEWRNSLSRLESELERSKSDIRGKDAEIIKLNKNATADASRIQDILDILEKTRYELTEKKISSQQDDNTEADRLKALSRQLETEKSCLEMKLSYMQSEMDSLKSALQAKESRCTNMVDPSSKVVRNKRVKILSKKPRRNVTRKIRSMRSILNHFGGGVSGDCGKEEYNKDDEWEDEILDGDEETETDMVTTERTNTSRSTSASIGTKIANVASRNGRGPETDLGRDRRSLAKERHVYRLQDTRDVSQDRDTGNSCSMCKTRSNRVSSLQQQLKAVTISRDGYKSKMKHSTRQIKMFDSDLMQAKARCERLVEGIKKQSGRIQVLSEERRQLIGNTEPSFSHERMWKEIGIDTDDVASIAKAHLDEVASQVTMVRDLHQALGQRDVQLIQLKEKLDRVERENTCKKKLIVDLRSKLQCLDGLKDRERSVVDAKEKKCKDLEDCLSRLKTQMESLHTRFNVVLNERRKFECEASNLTIKLELSEKKVTELKQAKQILEIQLCKIDQEKDGKMVEIISRSDLALDRMSQQIQCSKIKCSRYENLIVNLSRHLSDKSREIRRLIEFGQSTFRKVDLHKNPAKESPRGYDFARSKAADILSLSTSEIDSLLNGEMRQTTTRKQHNNSSLESKFDLSAHCKLAFRKEAFEQEVQDLFVDELDKIVDMVAPASSDSGCFSSS